MLSQNVIRLNYKWEAYRDRYNSARDPTGKEDWGLARGVQYTWRDGALHEDLPVWCAYVCKRHWGPELGIEAPPGPGPGPPPRPPRPPRRPQRPPGPGQRRRGAS